MIDPGRARADELIACAQHLQMLLRRRAPMLNGIQQAHVGAPLAREELGVEPIIAFATPPRAIHRARIRDEHLMPEQRHETTDPGRVRADLEHHATRWPLRQERGECRSRRRHGALLDAGPRRIHGVRLTQPIPEIESDRQRGNRRARISSVRHGRPPVIGLAARVSGHLLVSKKMCYTATSRGKAFLISTLRQSSSRFVDHGLAGELARVLSHTSEREARGGTRGTARGFIAEAQGAQRLVSDRPLQCPQFVLWEWLRTCRQHASAFPAPLR